MPKMTPRLVPAAVCALFAALTASAPHFALAHVTYTNRDFGTFLADGSDAPITITGQTVSSNFGWADASDSDFGDSHRLRAFRFALANSGLVTLTVMGASTGYSEIPGDPGLFPAFSIYSGLAHIAPAMADHDSSVGSLDYLTAIYGPGHGKEGSLIALGNWAIGNEDGEISHLVYLGHAADGTAANYGSASGINGDGSADHVVTQTFFLSAGEYSVFIGGAHYASQGPVTQGVNSANGSSYATYAITPTISVVPEPSSLTLLLMSCLLRLRRQVRRRHPAQIS